MNNLKDPVETKLHTTVCSGKVTRRGAAGDRHRLDERPLGSRRVVVRLRVRRYFCDRKRCSRRTFVEQVPGLSERQPPLEYRADGLAAVDRD